MWEAPPPKTLSDMRDHMIGIRDWLSDFDFPALSGVEAEEVLEFFAKLQRLATAGMMLAAPAVEDSFIWRQEGHKSPASYLAEKTGTTVGAAIGVLETAKQLAELPETAAALKWGAFSPEQVKEIASAATVHPGAEGELLEAAARCGLKALKVRCERTKALASWENDEVGRENAIRKSRFLRVSHDPDGGVRLMARLAPPDAARLLEAVKVKAGLLADEARRAGIDESMGAFMADGLVSLADDAIIGSGTGVGRPSVLLRVDAASLQRGEIEGNEVCELPGVGRVSLATAARLLGDANVKLVITNGVDVMNVCHLGRNIPAHVETALQERDRTCCVPLCPNDSRLEIHHIVPVSSFGQTRMSNLVRICKWHHDLVTYEGWKILGSPGEWAWHPPPDFDGL
jgi:hypothetical protein